MSANFGDQNYIYLYDLPKEDITSTQIAQAFESQANVTLSDGKPQIRRDLTRPFYSGIVQIKDASKFNEASEAMKYFTINGKWCRALKFDKQLLGSNKEKLLNNNVFIRKVPTDQSHQDLQTKFEKYGKIKSLKVSLNSDHSSRGYGFICFQDEASAVQAVEGTTNDDGAIAMKFEPKQQRSFLTLINNVYVKNIPLSMTDAEVRAMFEPFGTIQSLCLKKDESVKNYQFGFVCYNDAEGKDKEYGPKCAQEAIQGLNGKVMDAAQDMKLYVRAAMKKGDRETEKMKETLRYKTSKKRCNLYVKNFPASWEEEELTTLFKDFGKIEKIKISKQGSAVFAFVCFTTPDAAASAKQNLHNHTIEGKSLIINHYEIKELRELQREEAVDKSDYEKYMAQKTGGFHLNDLITHPHMTQILQQLIEIMQHNEQAQSGFGMNNGGQHRGGGGGRGGYQNNRNYDNRGGQRQNHGGNNMNNQQQMGGNQGGMPGMPGPNGNQQNRMPQAPMGQPPMPQQPGAGGPNQMPGQPMQQQQQANMTPQQKYLSVTSKILPSVNERNPYMKDQVGQTIFEFVGMMVPQERAPKITGMLIELPHDQIKQYLTSFEALHQKVNEATELINTAEKQAMQQ